MKNSIRYWNETHVLVPTINTLFGQQIEHAIWKRKRDNANTYADIVPFVAQ